MDGMERPIQRPKQTSTNRKHYSGKKKRHTRKAIVVADTNRRIGCLTRSKRGARHDKRLADARRVIQGLPDTVSDCRLRLSRKPAPATVPAAQRQQKTSLERSRSGGGNRLVAAVRVRVEHAIGGLKRFGAVANLYRNHKPCCDDRFNLLAAGLWNLRLAFRTT